jgi:hypothetical protein
MRSSIKANGLIGEDFDKATRPKKVAGSPTSLATGDKGRINRQASGRAWIDRSVAQDDMIIAPAPRHRDGFADAGGRKGVCAERSCGCYRSYCAHLSARHSQLDHEILSTVAVEISAAYPRLIFSSATVRYVHPPPAGEVSRKRLRQDGEGIGSRKLKSSRGR